ncbi:DUF3035 domain-containing protein [Telmatospirillum sp. J64-1]|uniref:DUF3035 domain-containing protein n=1 Tax=Telmatospirillum sp. J64-1 TaxID=2502183 RepID=UPI00115CD80F|nr:DUF3035 domain-containing protein [Telmatospirillum sp. J64-1]
MRSIARAGRVAFAGLLIALTATGCSETRSALGWDKQVPDEFAVVSRAPLALPPDYSLRPPAPGAVRPQEGTARDMARQSLLGRSLGPTTQIDRAGRSAGEIVLLRQAGADRADPEIRSLVNRESAALAAASESFTDRLLFWRDPAPAGVVVDAAAEARRLRENQALGRAVNEGDTPIIQRRQRGLLEGLF